MLKRKELLLKYQNCMFPGCEQKLIVDGVKIGEFAYIEAREKNGPRYKENNNKDYLMSEDNLIVLCPVHHKLIDFNPNKFTVEIIKEFKKNFIEKISEIPNQENKIFIEGNFFTDIASYLKTNKSNPSEEFWQQTFIKYPSIISMLFPQSVVFIDDKSYVGGKSIKNTGGNIVDFIYANKLTNNAVLVEIKTPLTKLTGKRYRDNTYSMSEEISGGIIQLKNYYYELLKNHLILLANTDIILKFDNAKLLLIIGSLHDLDKEMEKSFEIFRSCLNGIQIITYDEILEKVNEFKLTK